jgi:predicted phosphodiesterase
MVTPILGVCDPHFTDRKPQSRKDNYQETQLRKLRDIRTLTEKFTWEGKPTPIMAVAIAGDICHQPRGKLISRRLDVRLIEIFRSFTAPILAILGNHDKDRDRLDSIEDHTLGSLIAAGALSLTHWPDYRVIGTDPPVIITGRQYTMDGPTEWLGHLRSTRNLTLLKNQLSQTLGKPVFTYVMTHCNWGPNDGILRSDPIIGYHHLRGTGIDTMIYGHPHTDDGVTQIEDEGRTITIVGPGALVRGSIAEHDVNRQPKIAITLFNPNGDQQTMTVAVPHEPADKVFDLEKHERAKRERTAAEKFIQVLQATQTQARRPEEVIAAAAENTPEPVVALARHYHTIAAAEIKQ